MTSKLKFIGAPKLFLILNLMRLGCVFTFAYCLVNVITLMMIVAPKHTEMLDWFYRYCMTLPASVCIGLNAMWIFVLATVVDQLIGQYSLPGQNKRKVKTND